MKRHPAYALGAVVAASFVIRTALAWLRSAPVLLPDEYLYASIGRSFAESGRPLIRGESAHFPALLQPILTAPAWLIGDVDTAFRVIQTIGSLAMSLAAVPVYLIARRLGVSSRVSLVLSGFTVLVPDVFYSSFISSEAFAYPLFLLTVYAAIRVLAAPTNRAQILFVVAVGLTTLTRVQFAVLPIVFLVAIVLIGARERRLKTALREQTLALVLFGVAAAGVLFAGPSRSVGVYRWLLGIHTGPLEIVHWAALDAMTLAYAAGWIIVPGALLGCWLTLARPRSRDELVFGVLVVLLTVGLLLEAGLLQASLTLVKEIQERYVFYAAPLLGISFALYASRGWPLRVQHLALAAALVLVAVRIPLSGYAVAATLNGSPILYGVYWLTAELGRPGDAAAIVAAAVGLMTVVAVLASRRPRLGTPVVLGLALLAIGAASAGAVAFDVQNSARVKKAYLPSDASWVDHADVGDVTMVETYSGTRAISLQELFWNRSITRVVLLPGAAKLDSFFVQHARISEDGAMIVGGRPIAGPLLLDTFGSTVRLRGARLLDSGPTASLWLPNRNERPRLAFYALGYYYDGWLAHEGAMHVWPQVPNGRVSGWISMRLTAPSTALQTTGAMKLTFTLAKGRRFHVRLLPGQSRSVRLPICALGSAMIRYRSNSGALVGPRFLSVRSTTPHFTPSPSACPSGSSSSA